MKKQLQKTATLFTAACLSALLAAGCGASPSTGSDDTPVADLSSPAAPENAEPAQPGTTQDGADSGSSDESPDPETAPADTGADQTERKWHVYAPDVAAAVDADFEGTVWKIGENSFYIVPMESELLDSGEVLAIAPAPDPDIPDSELVQVVFDGSTRFYTRTIYNGGERYEDANAAFQDIEKDQTVSLRGSFENDIFHATEIQIVRVA